MRDEILNGGRRSLVNCLDVFKAIMRFSVFAPARFNLIEIKKRCFSLQSTHELRFNG